MKKELTYELITGLLVLLFLYTGLSKLLDFKNFEVSMLFQHLPAWVTKPMTYILPLSEILVAALMIPDKSRLAGIYAFLVMMIAFTLYVGAALLHLFPRAPCACGGMLKSLGWGQHFVLNLLFIIAAIIAIRYYQDKRRLIIKQKPFEAQDISRARNQVIVGPVVKPANISKYKQTMKKIRMGLMAIAALSGVGSAFAFSPKPQAITYYARQTAGNGFHWTKTVPNPNTAQCLTVPDRTCQISTSTAPTDNAIPAGHAADGHVVVTL